MFTWNKPRKALALVGLFCVVGFVANSAFAETAWQLAHPRRTEVNDRLVNQNQRINAEVAQGKISTSQAAALHAQDHQIRTEERAMASDNNGHITKAQKVALNQQENAVSRQISK